MATLFNLDESWRKKRWKVTSDFICSWTSLGRACGAALRINSTIVPGHPINCKNPLLRWRMILIATQVSICSFLPVFSAVPIVWKKMLVYREDCSCIIQPIPWHCHIFCAILRIDWENEYVLNE
jgi:hypothetical protein